MLERIWSRNETSLILMLSGNETRNETVRIKVYVVADSGIVQTLKWQWSGQLCNEYICQCIHTVTVWPTKFAQSAYVGCYPFHHYHSNRWWWCYLGQCIVESEKGRKGESKPWYCCASGLGWQWPGGPILFFFCRTVLGFFTLINLAAMKQTYWWQ